MVKGKFDAMQELNAALPNKHEIAEEQMAENAVAEAAEASKHN